MQITIVVVDNKFDPHHGSICVVDLNVNGAAEHAPEVKSCVRTIEKWHVLKNSNSFISVCHLGC